MTSREGYDAYCLYLAINNHFHSDSYDFFKYNGKVSAKLESFMKRKDKYHGSLQGWVAPSPNIPDFETAYLYSGFCLIEGTNLSEGRGTTTPFLVFGAPWMNSEKVLQGLLNIDLYGFFNDGCILASAAI